MVERALYRRVSIRCHYVRLPRQQGTSDQRQDIEDQVKLIQMQGNVKAKQAPEEYQIKYIRSNVFCFAFPTEEILVRHN